MNAFAIVKDSFSQHCDVESNLIYDGCKDLKPEITVAIPTFRRPELLRESVKSALAQETSVVYEVIVVDNEQDGSWSELVDEVLAEFMPENLRLFRNSKNIGMFGNWNRCISLARGRWVTILNDDDLLFSGFLDLVSAKRVGQRMVSCAVISGSDPHSFSKFSSSSCLGRDEDILLSTVIQYNPVPGSLGALFSKQAALDIGGYDEEFYPSSDYLFSAKYIQAHGAIKTADVGAFYRWEVNESLKVRALEGFLLKDKKIKIDLLDFLEVVGIRRRIADGLIALQEEHRANINYPGINPSFSRESNLVWLFFRRVHACRTARSIAAWLRTKLWSLLIGSS
ncbi:glycosyltransferase family 2 protein [Pseudomonas sp. s199]|uniref:glycosyltransferase family 2 protein n=1 Tax=Stutzerimonas nitrititolerans TaxID=2482751 RepID=UPI000F79D8B9|nr:glycosyltransferase family 2 protein [Stutzerimonas nitrititolerans]RRV21164.1 glycosyltransferase family 2 protein [Pseudomonas sp. s199]